MNNEELNVWIAETVMGEKPEHNWIMPEGETVFKCYFCKVKRGGEGALCRKFPYGQYVWSLDAVRNVEEKVVKEAGSDAYVHALEVIVETDLLQKMPWQINDNALSILADCTANETVMAIAEQRARACRAAWEEMHTKCTAAANP